MSNTDFMVAEESPTSSHAPHIAIAAPVRKRENSNTVARLPEKPCLDTATEPAIAVVKEEKLLDVMEAAESLCLSREAVATQKAFLLVMMTMCCVYIKDFRNFSRRTSTRGGKGMSESVGRLLCNPPYNVRRQEGFESSNHDVFSAKDTEAF